MNFHGRQTRGLDGVADGNTRVRVGGRIDEQRLEAPFSLADGLDDLAFVVRLDDSQDRPALGGQGVELPVDG